ncbi:MAG: co-chaperone GroES [Elusimicrobia bacterium]|nr:co-chaperone GroES [Elusimicrobiota bacterium]
MTQATLTQAIFQPLGDRALIKPMEAAETVRGGIIIPETAKEKPQEGIVEACGKGKLTESGKLLAMTVGPGDKVLFAKYSGTEIRIGEQDYLILTQDDIIALVKP